MAILSTYNLAGEKVKDREVSEKFLLLKPKASVVHQVLVAQMNNARRAIANTKDRSQVRGGGKKPWKQKGTGRARHGSIRSPLWRGGGVTFGPTKNRNFSRKINKKVRRQAILMALSGKVKDQQVLVLDQVPSGAEKTKTMALILKAISGQLPKNSSSKPKDDRWLVVLPGNEPKIVRAIRNLKYAKAQDVKSLNILDLLSYQYILLVKDAIPIMEKTYQA